MGSFVAILVVGAQSCVLDENGLIKTEGGASAESSSGNSSSSSSGKPSVCGDKLIEGAETCDDGNATQGDRCSATCMTENPTVCPGTSIAIKKGETVEIADTTVDGEDNFVGARPNVGNCGGDDYPGKDLIYAVTVLEDGFLSAELDADYDRPYIHARPACDAPKETELACDYIWFSGTTNIGFMVTANSTYFVAADSWENRAGTFRLKLTLN